MRTCPFWSGVACSPGLAPAALGSSGPVATTMLVVLLTAGDSQHPVLAECGESAQDLEPRSHANLPAAKNGAGALLARCRENAPPGGQRIHLIHLLRTRA